MTRGKRIGSILVCGAGIVGLSAAIAFARALPKCRVKILALRQDPAALADRMPNTLPAVRHFHRLIGLDEPRLVRQAGATHRIGTRFDAWSANGEPWFHCFGRHGATIRSSPFHHQWARMRSEGRALDFDHYAPVTALARAEKFVHPVEDQTSLLASFDYALRLDPILYHGVLMDEAVRAGVELHQADIGEVRLRDDGGVGSVVAADGAEFEADLFIDCGGPAAPLLSRVDRQFDDWSEGLPCNRIILGRRQSAIPSPVDVATATASGWRMAIPLLSSSVACAAYCSALTDDRAAEQEFRQATGLDEFEILAIRPGRRPSSWVGNVVAFGDSAVALDPLEGTNLALAQSAIRRAVALLPDSDFLPLLLDEYNRQTRFETERARDFIAVHYLAAKRTDGELWAAVAAREKPASLRHTLEQFEGRGRLPSFEEESFEDDSWRAVLFGLGLMPARIDPTAYRIDQGETLALMDRIAHMSAAVPAQLPSYSDYLARLIAG